MDPVTNEVAGPVIIDESFFFTTKRHGVVRGDVAIAVAHGDAALELENSTDQVDMDLMKQSHIRSVIGLVDHSSFDESETRLSLSWPPEQKQIERFQLLYFA